MPAVAELTWARAAASAASALCRRARSVSYTHLDVYKRQIQCELEALLLVNMEMSSLQFMEALEELADRQWHTYTLLASPLMARVEQMCIRDRR